MSVSLRLLAALLGILIAHQAHAFGSDDKWTAGWGQGIAEAIVNLGPGNSIYVTCDEGAGRNATGISFYLRDRAPTGSQIFLTFDNNDPEAYSIFDGEISSDCRACAANYDAVIEKFKTHSSVHVLFKNGDGARFTLNGADEAIGECTADFWR